MSNHHSQRRYGNRFEVPNTSEPRVSGYIPTPWRPSPNQSIEQETIDMDRDPLLTVYEAINKNQQEVIRRFGDMDRKGDQHHRLAMEAVETCQHLAQTVMTICNSRNIDLGPNNPFSSSARGYLANRTVPTAPPDLSGLAGISTPTPPASDGYNPYRNQSTTSVYYTPQGGTSFQPQFNATMLPNPPATNPIFPAYAPGNISMPNPGQFTGSNSRPFDPISNAKAIATAEAAMKQRNLQHPPKNMSPRAFMEELTEFMAEFGLNVRQQLSLVKVIMNVHDSAWVRQYQNSWLTWNDFVQCYLDYFGTTRTDSDILRDIMETFQPATQDPKAFISDMMSRYQSMSRIPTEADQVSMIKSRLLPQLQLFIDITPHTVNTYTQLSKAVGEAQQRSLDQRRSAEQLGMKNYLGLHQKPANLKIVQEKSPEVATVDLEDSDSEDVDLENFEALSPKYYTPQTTPSKLTKGSGQRTQDSNTKKKRQEKVSENYVCSNCGLKGIHSVRNCRNDRILDFCVLCLETGHTSKNCPTLDGQNL